MRNWKLLAPNGQLLNFTVLSMGNPITVANCCSQGSCLRLIQVTLSVFDIYNFEYRIDGWKM